MIGSILRIIRFQNLLIVGATLYTIRFFIIQPLLIRDGMSLQLNELLFSLIVVSTMLITAAGYVINDYFDTRTDQVNRPNTVIVGKKLSRLSVIIMHWSLNIVGVLLGCIVSLSIGKPFLTLVFIFIPGLLWFYSTSYKRQLLVGNVIVAALTALVPLMPMLFELPLLYTAYWQIMVFNSSIFNGMIYWVGGYAIFAFCLTLFREIVKDIEDVEGDNVYGSRSLPVVLGINATRTIASSILLLTIIILVYLFGAYLNFLPSGKFDYFTFSYMILGLIIPIFILMLKLLSAQHKGDYHWASNFAKLIMLIGILYAIPFRFLVL